MLKQLLFFYNLLAMKTTIEESTQISLKKLTVSKYINKS